MKMTFTRFTLRTTSNDSRRQENQVKENGHPSDVPKLLLDNLFIYDAGRGTRVRIPHFTLIDTHAHARY